MLSTVSGRGHAWVTLLRSGCLGMGLGACQIVPGFSLLRYGSAGRRLGVGIQLAVQEQILG